MSSESFNIDGAGERDGDDKHLQVQDGEHDRLHLSHQAGLQEHLLAGVQVRITKLLRLD